MNVVGEPGSGRATDAELNSIFVPFSNAVADFKDGTKISWLVILPAVQELSARLSVVVRGLEATRRHYQEVLHQVDKNANVPAGSIVGLRRGEVPPEQIAQTNAFLWKFANDKIARGFPIDHISQAFAAFAIMIAEKKVDALYATFLVKDTFRKLQSEEFE